MVPHSAFLTRPYCGSGDVGSGRKVSSQRKTWDNLGKESKFAWLKFVVYALS